MFNDLCEIIVQHLINNSLLVWGSLLLGLSFAFALQTILQMPVHGEKKPDGQYDYDQSRRRHLRNHDTLFRLMERFILEILSYNRNTPKCEIVRRSLPHAKKKLPWTPEEYLSTQQVTGFFVAVVIGTAFWNTIHPLAGVVAGFFTGYLFVELMIKSLADEADSRRKKIIVQLPFVVDLMALTRGAGATFQESIEVIAQECSGTPIGEEFADLVRQISLGRSQRQVFEDLANRMNDSDFDEMTFALNKADELGTPITETLSELADQMRLKKQQRGEKASGEAQVKIMFPGVIIMVACLIVIVVPFLLQALYTRAV